MACTAQRIDTLDNLRKFVSQTICDHEQLEADAYVMTEMVLTRPECPVAGTTACTVPGPRNTQPFGSAIAIPSCSTIRQESVF